MGYHPGIKADRFPKQSDRVGQRAVVIFAYDSSRRFGATILRDDLDDPYRMVLRLDDGRVVLSSECQWHPGDVKAEVTTAMWPGQPGAPA